MLLLAGAAWALTDAEVAALRAAADEARAQEAAARANAIRVLEGRVRADPDPASLLRLAELWQLDADARELVSLADHVARYDACHDTPGCDLAAVTVDPSVADRSRRRAAIRYRQLLRDFPDSPEADDAAYGLGWAWRAMGEEALGDAAFTWLLAARPESPYGADAWLLVGERAFEAWDAEWAAFAYERVVETDDPRRAWALHRLAWSRYRLGDDAGAIDTMKRVVAEAPGDGPGVVDLRDEALKDLVRFYADAGELDDPLGGCRLGQRSAVRDMLVRIADVYAEQGKFEQAIQVWRRVVAEDPSAPEVPTFQARIVDTYRDMARFDEAASELDRLVRFVDARPGDGGAIASLERSGRSLAFEAHRWGRSSGTLRGRGGSASPWRPSEAERRRLSVAVGIYAWHAERFPDAEHASDVAWAWAVALEDLGRDAEALEKYQAILLAHPDGRYARDAAAAMERLGR